MATDSTIFYPQWINLEKAEVHSATSEASGYPKERLLDGNLKKAWKPTSSANQDIWIDLNKTDLIEGSYAVGFFIKNYNTDHSNSGAADFTLAHSSSPSGGAGLLSESLSSDLKPIRIFDISGNITPNRYLKFSFVDLNTVLEISHFFFARKIIVAQAPQMPENIKDVYYNRLVMGITGDLVVNAISRDGQSPEIRHYKTVTAAVFQNIQSVYTLSRGPRNLMAMIDSLDGTPQDPVAIRVMGDFNYPSADYGIYDCIIEIYPVPYYTDGYGY